MNEDPNYHCVESCNACGGDNNIWWVEYINYPCEAETTCNQCGNSDYWAYGYFQSGIGKCETYNFD